MKVYINQKEIEIFAGACVKDAVVAFDKTSCKLFLSGKLAAYDSYGNNIEPDGALTAGQSLTLKPTHSS